MSDKPILEPGEVKPGPKTTEFKLAIIGVIASCIVAAAPAILRLLPPDGMAAVMIGSLVAIAGVLATYFGSRASTKNKAGLAKAMVEAAKVGGSKPPDPT
jgi:hypothetical protein